MIPLRKTAETIMALFVTGYGAYAEVLINMGYDPLRWAEADHFMAWSFIAAGLLHAVGIRLNGARNWSPFLRLAGLVFGMALFMKLAFAGVGLTSTAGYVYTWVFVGFGLALKTTIRDCRIAARGVYGRTV